jgi:hypothetical protein
MLKSQGRRSTARCWFDEPEPGDRRLWAMPAVHGTYQGINLDHLDPDDEHDREVLIKALHPQFGKALRDGGEIVVDGQAVNPRLHVIVHQVAANQLLADDPPETWLTVQRLAGLGYNWHTIMHMLGGLVAENISRVTVELKPFNRADYLRSLDALPGDWPLKLTGTLPGSCPAGWGRPSVRRDRAAVRHLSPPGGGTARKITATRELTARKPALGGCCIFGFPGFMVL